MSATLTFGHRSKPSTTEMKAIICRSSVLVIKSRIITSPITSIAILKPFEKCIQLPAHSNREIHITGSRESPKLLLAVALRPVISALSVVIARWWRKKTPEEREKIRKHRCKIYLVGIAYILSCFGYYLWHTELTPITKRRRFMALSKKDLEVVTEETVKQILKEYGSKTLYPFDPRVRRVLRVSQNLVAANSDLPHIHGEKITVTVLDAPGVMNAMVTIDGRIIVFKDMLDVCSTDDELAIVISHELSHAVLDHMAEKASGLLVTGFLFFPFVAAFSLILPSELFALPFAYLVDKFLDFFVELPFSRKIEIEADKVGLMLAARACYDVRQSVVFWNKMKEIEAHQKGISEVPKFFEYLRTHPLHETRAEILSGIMHYALDIRDKCQCPKLPPFRHYSKPDMNDYPIPHYYSPRREV